MIAKFIKDFTWMTPGGEWTLQKDEEATLRVLENGKAVIVMGHGNFQEVPQEFWVQVQYQTTRTRKV